MLPRSRLFASIVIAGTSIAAVGLHGCTGSPCNSCQVADGSDAPFTDVWIGDVQRTDATDGPFVDIVTDVSRDTGPPDATDGPFVDIVTDVSPDTGPPDTRDATDAPFTDISFSG